MNLRRVHLLVSIISLLSFNVNGSEELPYSSINGATNYTIHTEAEKRRNIRNLLLIPIGLGIATTVTTKLPADSLKNDLHFTLSMSAPFAVLTSGAFALELLRYAIEPDLEDFEREYDQLLRATSATLISGELPHRIEFQNFVKDFTCIDCKSDSDIAISAASLIRKVEDIAYEIIDEIGSDNILKSTRLQKLIQKRENDIISFLGKDASKINKAKAKVLLKVSLIIISHKESKENQASK